MKLEKSIQKRYSAVFIAPDGEKNLQEYAHRREILRSKSNYPIAISGVTREPGSEEECSSTWSRLVQDPTFLYLTGINQPGCYLWLDPFASLEEREVLFIPRKNSLLEFWNGVQLGVGSPEDLEEIKTLTGFRNIRNSEDFVDFVEKKLQEESCKQLGLFYSTNFPNDHHGEFFQKILELSVDYSVKIKNIALAHFQERCILSDLQISHLRKATKATKDAFVTCLEQWDSFKTERDLYLRLNYEMLRQVDSDLAFPTIAASGENACCLHYVKNDEDLKPHQMVLLDFGARSGTVCCDISRTVPISRRFSPLQKLIYSVVLDTQKFHESQVGPGKNLLELDKTAWSFLNERLSRVLAEHEGGMELLYEDRPHGISHFIGEMVHEGGFLSKKACFDRELLPGMLISNEPGVYGTFWAVFDGILHKETFGIRIEDDLLITETGCENISIEIPKSIEDLERMLDF